MWFELQRSRFLLQVALISVSLPWRGHSTSLVDPLFSRNFTTAQHPLRAPKNIENQLKLMQGSEGLSKPVEELEGYLGGQRRTAKQIIVPGVYSCGHQGSETFINLINPHYPDTDLVSGTCHFRVIQNSPDVCQVNRASFTLLRCRNNKRPYCIHVYTIQEKDRIKVFVVNPSFRIESRKKGEHQKKLNALLWANK